MTDMIGLSTATARLASFSISRLKRTGTKIPGSALAHHITDVHAGCPANLWPRIRVRYTGSCEGIIHFKDRELTQCLQELDQLDEETCQPVVGVLKMAIKRHKAKTLLNAS
jgi:hypothetical protein